MCPFVPFWTLAKHVQYYSSSSALFLESNYQCLNVKAQEKYFETHNINSQTKSIARLLPINVIASTDQFIKFRKKNFGGEEARAF